MNRAAFLLALFLLPTTSAAQQLSYELDEAAASKLGLDTVQLQTELNDSIGTLLDLGGQQAFLKSMADAAAIGGKGMGVDYATNPKRLIVGASVGSGGQGSGASLGSGAKDSDLGLPESGFSAQIALMAGLNLGLFTPGDDAFADRIRIFVSGMSATLPSGTTPFDTSMYNVGAHLQWKMIGKPNPGSISWGGIDLTTGWERSTYTLSLEEGMPVEVPVDGATLEWDATGSYKIGAQVDSIPIELSTNLSLLVATAFAGAAVDINTSTADTSIALSGPMTAKAGGEKANIGRAELSFQDKAAGDVMVPRVFGGLQANILLIKVYGQVNVAMNQSFGGHMGLRVAL